jgi:hypothetical protein
LAIIFQKTVCWNLRFGWAPTHMSWSFAYETNVFDRGTYQEPEAVSDWFARIVSKKHATPEQIIALKRNRRSQAK